MNNIYKNIKKNKVFAYVRCSNEENNLKNNGSSVKTQIFRINSYCNIHNLKISETFTDYCSGGIELEKREQGKILFSKLKNNNSIIISSDLSRFSRNHLDLIQLVHSFRKEIKNYNLVRHFFCIFLFLHCFYAIFLFCFYKKVLQVYKMLSKKQIILNNKNNTFFGGKMLPCIMPRKMIC